MSACGRSGWSARLVLFSRQPICCTNVGGDGYVGYSSAAAGQPNHLLIKLKCTFFDTAVGPRPNFARMCA